MMKIIHKVGRFPWRKLLALGCMTLVCMTFWLDHEQTQLAGKMVRLHVLANSDSEEDQALKLKVRDQIIQKAEPWLSGKHDIASAENALRDNLPQLKSAAEEVVREEGYAYPITVNLEQTWFPTRQYEGFSLPAGNYEALRILIGEGSGHNWWCVVFPPLCLASATETVTETATDAGLTEKQVSFIEEQEEEYVIKFKAMEWWETLKNTFS